MTPHIARLESLKQSLPSGERLKLERSVEELRAEMDQQKGGTR